MQMHSAGSSRLAYFCPVLYLSLHVYCEKQIQRDPFQTDNRTVEIAVIHM